ncbi:unnamed protein product [Brassica rapa subsp. trilocularis]
MNVSYNPQLDFPLLSTNGVECRGPLLIFSVLSFVFISLSLLSMFSMLVWCF